MDVEKHETSWPSQDTASIASTVHEPDDLEANRVASHPDLPGKEKASIGVLSRTLSRIRTKDASDPGPPPDGGRTAWTQVALTHLVIFNTWYRHKNQKIFL